MFLEVAAEAVVISAFSKKWIEIARIILLFTTLVFTTALMNKNYKNYNKSTGAQ